jgi:hypothetical protein
MARLWIGWKRSARNNIENEKICSPENANACGNRPTPCRKAEPSRPRLDRQTPCDSSGPYCYFPAMRKQPRQQRSGVYAGSFDPFTVRHMRMRK